MKYAIIGTGNLGAALARQFVRSGIPVRLANSRGPDSFRSLTADLGDLVEACSLERALLADIIIFAVPFAANRALAQSTLIWYGKIVIDAMNAREQTPEELGGLQSTDAVAKLLPGAKVVKTFNQLPAVLLASDPAQNGGRRVMFLAGNDVAATQEVAALMANLGFAPINLGRIDEGGSLLRFRGQLVLQDLIKLDS